MSKTENLFFELLQIAIGTRQSLSVMPIQGEWRQLFEIAKKQALTAVAFRGVSKLRETVTSGDGFGGGIGIDEMTYLKWLGLTAKVGQRNRQVSEACVELVGQLALDGLKSCILKGQSNLVNYPEDLREYRTAGDIDIWVQPMDDGGIDIAVGDLDARGAHYERYTGNRAVIEYALMQWRLQGAKEKPDMRFHHIDFPEARGVAVEMHFRPMFCDSPLRCYRFLKWCRENEQFGVCDALINGCVLPVPTASFNAVYQLMHIQRHLVDEGVGLRQLLDYYFVLRALHIEQGSLADRTESMAQWAEGMGNAVASNEEVMHTLQRTGLKRLAASVMYVLKVVLNMPSEYMICEPDEVSGDFFLNEILIGGNFGKSDNRYAKAQDGVLSHFIGKTRHNLAFLRFYTEEVLCEPFFRIYHWVWRKLELWRW